MVSHVRSVESVVLTSELQLDTREGFLRKPVECKVGMKRRHV